MNISKLGIFGLTAFLLLWGAAESAPAQTLSLELMAGSAYNFPTPLTVHQAGYPDIHLTADYNTEPFGPYTPYYAWRFSLWDKDEAWEFEQVHHRLFLTDPPPEIQNFSIHFGYNFFLLGHAWKRGDFIFHADAGILITNPENTVRGQVLRTGGTGIFDAGYNFSGLGCQVAVSRDFYFAKNFYLVLDVGLMAGWAVVPVANGSADVPNISLHGRLGPGFSF
ncbi:MAG TPA: hypothetical protein VK859_09670 [bacterium]|jgi:hypothetical protein|nr:hypothetical protein [bacterium]